MQHKITGTIALISREQLKAINKFKAVKQFKRCIGIILLATTFLAAAQNISAQSVTCEYKQTVINLDFGTSSNRKDVALSFLKNYQQTNSTCPDDGWFSYSAYTTDCFNGNWHNVPEDHSPGDFNGQMMVVNAAEMPGMFFANKIAGLKPGVNYEISVWFVNVCLRGVGCYPTPPVINISVNTPGKQLVKFQTGELSPTEQPVWRKFTATFTMPAAETSVLILMDDITQGGCGNDFAMDDLLIKECIPPVPPSPKIIPPIIKKIAPPTTVVKPPVTVIPKPVVKEPVISPKNATPIEKAPAAIPVVSINTIKEKMTTIQLPAPILKRENTLAKQIETETAEMVIDLYDNGEIDGDTVTVYHNNQLVVSHAGISAKAITFKIKVDEQHPYHELLMVADNLGSIPPNTSLMVITADKKRYEIFISSSEQKNAKVVIVWKKE